jgi:crossover junction endodeoxyribonuclease RusA
LIGYELPWPPSVNHYWDRRGWRSFLSKAGKKYRHDSYYAIIEQGRPSMPMQGKLEIVVKLFPPNRRMFDIDNLMKGIFDALTHARVIMDDSQFRRMTVEDTDQIAGVVEVYINPLGSTANNEVQHAQGN